MTKILTICDFENEDVLRNHQHYARLYGFVHIWTSTRFMDDENLRTAYKYDYLLQQLKACEDGELVMLLDGHTAIYKPISIVDAMEGQDSFVCYGPESADKSPCVPMRNLLILRNTAENRTKLHETLLEMHGRLAEQDYRLTEYACLEKFGVLPTNAQLGGRHINVNWTIPQWADASVFALHLGMSVSFNADGKPVYDRVHDYNLEEMLFKRINGALIEGRPALEPPNYAVISEEPVSHFNPQGRIALVTLYTHHITTYARVSEHNVKRYCDRHGYAYHVYRAIPPELDSNINGTWVKSWLLKNNISNHDWVIWVDADVLFKNQSQKLEEILEGRDLLFAKDLCAWPINAGIMGFRNTPENVLLIDKIWQRMTEIKDKSTTYSEMGDQHHTINVLVENNILNAQTVQDCLTINTSPQLSNADTLLTHYVGWGEPYRSIYMAHDDHVSLRRG